MSVDAGVVACGAVAAAAAVANWWSRVGEGSAQRRVELISKPLATIAIAVTGVAGALSRDHHPPTLALVATIVAFVLCLGGDVALMPAVDNFVAGLASFLLGHVAFVVAFASLGFDRWWLALVALAGVAVVVGTVGTRIVRGASAKDPALGVPVRAYLGVISVMALAGWATGRPAAIIGASAFVVSDSILGWEQFVSRRRWMPLAIMVTYHLALAGLAVAIWV